MPALMLYTVVGVLLLPLAALVVAVGGLFKRDWWLDMGARFGLIAPREGDRPIVVWCASVGEVNTARRVIDALIDDGRAPVVVAAYTPTGLLRARDLFGDRAEVVLAPLDIYPAARRWLRRLQPALLVLLETEIWPLTVLLAKRAGARVALINARLSDRNFPTYRRLRFALHPVLARLDAVLAQNEVFAARFRALGARPAATRVTGSLKFEIEPPPPPAAEAQRFYQAFIGARPIVVAGSTHPGEERILLDALKEMRRETKDCALIIAPRHIKRADEIERLIRAVGWRPARRSQMESTTAEEADVLLVDAFGELGWIYGLGRAAFVGGSFNAAGGHNVLEPAAAGTPVVVGPLTPNFRQEVEALREVNGLIVVEHPSRLAGILRRLLGDEAERERLIAAAQSVVHAHRGATMNNVNGILELLPRV